MQSIFNQRYFDEDELKAMNFKSLGSDVKIARTARLYLPEYIAIGNFSVVDDFCIISGNVELGTNVHIAHGGRLIGGLEGIRMGDFSGLAFGGTIFSQTDDYGGLALTGPTVPMKFRRITRARVEVGRHAIIGAGAIILPGVQIGEGSSIGACSLVTKSTESWSINLGIPARRLRDRRRDLLALEQDYLRELSHSDGK
ncbi:MAG: acyltransferase [Rubrivivax sp.]|nr:acyltransferase [Rubrivivax sp.]